jgi:hypothetical protein
MKYTSRAAWGAVLNPGLQATQSKTRVVIHHAPERVISPNPTPEHVYEQVRIIEDWHGKKITPTNPRIGYEWIVVEQTGEIIEALGWNRVGAHVGGHNTLSLGILILGIDGRKETGSDRTWRRIAEIVQEGIRRRSLIPRPELSPHNRYVATICPGGVLTRYVEKLTLDELLALLHPVVAPAPSALPEGFRVKEGVQAPLYSPALGQYMIPVRVDSNEEWWCVRERDVLALPRIKAGTPLSAMPRAP